MVRLFDINDDGRIDYYEFISSLHPRDSYKPMNDADKIEDEVIREVAQCRCCDRFAIEQISDNKYRVSNHRDTGFPVMVICKFTNTFSLVIPNNYDSSVF